MGDRSFRLPPRVNRAEVEVQQEIEFYIEMRAQECIAAGMDPTEARASALKAFGDRKAIEEECQAIAVQTVVRDQRREFMRDLWQDIRLAVRGLAKTPSFTAIALVTLALGVGGTTAMFSLVHGVLLQSLPYVSPAELVQVATDMRSQGIDGPEYLSPPDFRDWESKNVTFAGMAAYSGWNANLSSDRDPEQLTGMAVSAAMMSVLGVRPAWGRDFLPDDDLVGAARVVLLSHGLWQRRFGGDPEVIGQSFRINGEQWEVVGVLPATLRFVVPGVEIWRPIQELFPTGCDRGCVVLRVIGRLKPGVSLAAAQTDLGTIAARIALAFPRQNEGVGAWVLPLQTQVSGAIEPALWALLGAVGLFLVMACVNLAGLLLARGAGRQHEVSLRAALGAGRGRLIRQLLTESAVSAIEGGGVGVLLAAGVLGYLTNVLPLNIREMSSIAMSLPTLVFASAVSIGAGLVFGIVPAIQVSGTNVAGMLRSGAHSLVQGVSAARRLLVTLEVALALMLLSGAGLMMRSFLETRAVDMGFQVEGLSVGAALFPTASYMDPKVAVDGMFAWRDEILRQPYIRHAALSSIIPLTLNDNDANFSIVGRESLPDNRQPVGWFRQVSEGYFQTMGIPVVAGREFTPEDRRDAPLVGLVNETMARRYWGGDSPIGSELQLGPSRTLTIVGVVGDIYHNGPTAPRKAEWYLALRQFPARQIGLIIRDTGVQPDVIIRDLRASLRTVDAELPLQRVATFTSLLSDQFALPRLYLELFGAFALLALFMAGLGIYGVMSSLVNLRSRELGVRMALGANRSEVHRLVFRDAARMVALGLGVGLIGTVVLGRLLERLLFGVTPHDVPTLLAVSVVLAGFGMAAALRPALRASQVDPVEVMRS